MAIVTPETGSTFDGYEPFGTGGVTSVSASNWVNIADCKQVVAQIAPKAGADATSFEVKVEVATNNGNGIASPVVLATKDGTDGDTSVSITDNAWAFIRFNVTKLTAGGNPSHLMLSGRGC